MAPSSLPLTRRPIAGGSFPQPEVVASNWRQRKRHTKQPGREPLASIVYRAASGSPVRPTINNPSQPLPLYFGMLLCVFFMAHKPILIRNPPLGLARVASRLTASPALAYVPPVRTVGVGRRQSIPVAISKNKEKKGKRWSPSGYQRSYS